jgi:hypothetical protein
VLASEALSLEERGAYGRAAEALRELRRSTAPDADLEIALALDEARSGRLDSAAALLWGPLLTAALADTLPVSRRHDYLGGREHLWINGTFDGWHWYIARARAEVAAARGGWEEALPAARLSVAARPLAGKEWLILAVCAGRFAATLDTGAQLAARSWVEPEAANAAARAAFLDPSLPEARYLAGLHAWRARSRATAQSEFRAALALDSTYRAPALALVRSRLPASAPDTLPTVLLTGVREIGLLTSSIGPKIEESIQLDQPASLLEEADPGLSDSLRATFTARQMALPVLIDERGRIVLHELPWFDPARLPEIGVSRVVGSLPRWRFEPGMKNGEPRRMWGAIEINFQH